jgi:DNA replication licensing factor MCM4
VYVISLPRSPGRGTPQRSRRGDIHPPSGSIASPAFRARTQQNNRTDATSEADPLFPSSFPALSAQALPSENADEAIKVIWGTNVSILESMSSFGDFLRHFKIKYRIAYDREHGSPWATLPNPEVGERLLYQDYLRKMRITTQTNLNLDGINLAAYPPTRKLYTQLIKYPQELVPIMDQVLKDAILSLAEEDAEREDAGGMARDITREEIDDMAGRVYMVRPFGIPTINMRSLNPSGMLYGTIRVITSRLTIFRLQRYRQALLHQRFGHSCHTSNS